MIGMDKIREAAEEIGGIVHRTPVLTSMRLNELAGNEVYLKGEHLQKTGSFKIRGASNKVLKAVRGGASHVVAASSGNHGQAVAYIAGKSGIQATIVVPEDASPVKISAIEAYGGRVVRCGLTSAERIPEALRIAKESGGVFVPPYDDPDIIAGQGTTGMEIISQVPGCEAIFVPVGGGGLAAGVVCAVKQLNPDILVIGVEPEMADDTRRSLEAGERIAIGPTGTIADGLRTSIPGELTFPILQDHLDLLITVSEKEIAAACTFLFQASKQVVEPSGAVSVAGLLSGKSGIAGRKTAAVLSGGNVSPQGFTEILKA
ncbi:threonine dehydratase [Bhargavaea ginsengi]|uniref:threonine ammonia-lyase n=1 Tax=Bhargavaea ginsengi TaxID=426757 RepID=A0A1H6XSA8_9BACL|nr:threonine/serine dehydratase [Bhargavaea ginsengi]SEJ27740.1 threonine dehydratase [Bhargavaea ginsengi]